MLNAVYITYGGQANNGNYYFPYKAIAHSADEAIAVINTWKSYGRKYSVSPVDNIRVNVVSEKKIRALFKDGFGQYLTGEPKSYMGIRTTGCGAWEIGFHHALADSVEEHERIINELRETQDKVRKEAMRKTEERRRAELNVQRRGWYHVELTFTAYVFSRHGNDYFADLTSSGDIIAENGAEAYRKMVNEITTKPLTYHGQMAMVHAIPEALSDDFSYTFLGVKTDDGYSVEKWEEWKAKGEI